MGLKKGQYSGNGFKKGHLVSQETKDKIGKANAGREQTEKEKLKKSIAIKKLYLERKIIPYWKGKKKSEETLKKLRGKIPWNKNKKGVQKAWNKNISCSEEHKEAQRKAMIGRKQSKETINKRMKNMKGHKNFNINFKGCFTKESRSKMVFPLKDTKIEVKIQNYLKQLGITFFTHQYMKEIEHSYQCDIFIPSLNLIIECDGNYWHKYPTGTEMDKIRTKELIEKGFKVLRLWEVDINKMNMEDFNKKIGGEKIGGFT